MSGPAYHGRTHSAGGTDPIPGMGGGSGIQFDTYPQDGGWLYAETTDGDTSPNGWAIELNDQAALADAAGIWLHSAHGSVLIAGATGVTLSTSGRSIAVTGSGIAISGTPYELAVNTDVKHNANNSTISGHRFTIPASGGVFEVVDGNGQALFRVDSDGDLHGLTGKALTFDL